MTKPQPHEQFTSEDAYHLTWLIAPSGLMYKMPFQGHQNWIQDYKEAGIPELDTSEDVDGNTYYSITQQGWIRISDGTGLGIVIDIDPKHNPNINMLCKFIMMMGGYKFTISVCNTEIFETDLDYKEALRIVRSTQ